jgi:hypothetical protein
MADVTTSVAVDKLIAPVTARVGRIEEALKELLKVTALEKTVEEFSKRMDRHGSIVKVLPVHDSMLRKAIDELSAVRKDTARIQAAADKMEARMSKAEVAEARLKGIETMIRSMEQSIDMLQRRR